MAFVGLIIGAILLFVRLYARQQIDEGMADPYTAWSVGVVDRGKDYKVLVSDLRIVPEEDEQVQQYFNNHPGLHSYFKVGDPRYGKGQKYRYAMDVNINGQLKTVVSQMYPNNEAGMHLNIKGKTTGEVNIAPNGDVLLLFW